MVEQTVGDGTADALMKEDEQQCDFAAFVREPIGVAADGPAVTRSAFVLAKAEAEAESSRSMRCWPLR